jgi:hypothetical protein
MNKGKSEKKLRDELSAYAKIIGAEKDLEQLFHKWDTAIAMAPQDEKVAMAEMAILELHILLGIPTHEGVVVNGKVIAKASTKKHDQLVVPVAVKEKR